MLKPPQPKGLPLLGHLPQIAKERHQFLPRLGHTYGDICRFRLGTREVYLVNHPDWIQQVIGGNKWVRTPVTRKMMASFLGQGVFSLEGPPHLQQRRLMQPAFHRERLIQYTEIMTAQTHRYLSTWQDGETRDIDRDMMRLTLEIVSQCLFGASTSAEAAEIGEAFAQVQRAVDREYRLYALLPQWMPVIRFGAAKRAVEFTQRVTHRIVEARRKAGKDHGDLLSMLISAKDEDGSALTDEQITAEVLSLIFAGHETTANTLAWTLYLLSENPEALAKLTAESDAVFGGRLPAYADLANLPYNDWVLKESLRLYPSAWYAERTPLEDTSLGDYPIKAGTPVVFSTWVTHRDPRFFDQPTQFIPERFAPENAHKIHRYAYLPFGAGAHQCIGNVFATLESRLIIGLITSRFTLKTSPDHVPVPHAVVTMGIENGLPMCVTARHTKPGTILH
ncbi:MAG: cytochrome P450 [Anaerolineae bacterium]